MLETDVLVGGLNAISEIHPQAIEQARKCDEQKAAVDFNKYPLFGMPITFKENILMRKMLPCCKLAMLLNKRRS